MSENQTPSNKKIYYIGLAILALILLVVGGIAFLTKNITSNNDEFMPSENIPVNLNVEDPYPAPEIQGIANWINSEPLSIKKLKGKVVIIDFWTYSCINCIRTLPYLQSWHEKYASSGLVLIGMHAPEFAFEKKLDNVAKAVRDFGLTYPSAQDNDFATWRAYENRFWPAKYFIDHEGNVVHTHFGEGAYEESEEIIRHLLKKAGNDLPDETGRKDPEPTARVAQSPETYLGYDRGAGFVNSDEFKPDKTVNYKLGDNIATSSWSLGGKWFIGNESSLSRSNNSVLRYNFAAKEVFLVMGSEVPAKVQIKLDGKKITSSSGGGEDVSKNSTVTVGEPKLYRIINLDASGSERLLELTFPEGVEINAFTFGS